LFSVLKEYVAVDVELLETENRYEALARVTMIDGNLKILVGKKFI